MIMFQNHIMVSEIIVVELKYEIQGFQSAAASVNVFNYIIFCKTKNAHHVNAQSERHGTVCGTKHSHLKGNSLTGVLGVSNLFFQTLYMMKTV